MMSRTDSINREACEWIARLHDRELTPSDAAALKAWLQQSPAHGTELRRMAERWEELNVLTELAVPVEAPGIQRPSIRRIFSGRFGVKMAAIAASVAVVAISATLFWAGVYGDRSDALTLYATDVGEQQRVSLPDSSVALLNTNSQLRVDYTDLKRTLYLTQGEAHFEVTSDPNRPFHVHVGNSIVRAVGTAFSVHLHDAQVEVTVTEGSVSVLAANSRDDDTAPVTENADGGPTVKAGQVAVFDQVNDSVRVVESIDNEDIVRRLAWQDGLLRFFGDPLDEVVSEVSRYTDLSIVITDADLRDLRIGGIFEVGETDKMLEALEQGFGVRVERINDSLVHLSSK